VAWQEMDGETNMEEGKIETWTEQWCKTFEADGRLAHTHAEKVNSLALCPYGSAYRRNPPMSLRCLQAHTHAEKVALSHTRDENPPLAPHPHRG
jgi:hypothetical protein